MLDGADWLRFVTHDALRVGHSGGRPQPLPAAIVYDNPWSHKPNFKIRGGNFIFFLSAHCQSLHYKLIQFRALDKVYCILQINTAGRKIQCLCNK